MNTNDNETKKELTLQQRKQRQKMLVYPAFVLIFLGCLWLIFRPASNSHLLSEGLNTEIPMPADEAIIDNKIAAYENDIYLTNSRSKRLALDEFESLIGETSSQISIKEEGNSGDMYNSSGFTAETSPVHTSANLYQNINRQITTLYDEPYSDEQREQELLALEYRIQELERVAEEKEILRTKQDEQLALMEKSYEMAARYFPNAVPQQTETAVIASQPRQDANRRSQVTSVGKVNNSIVSSLAPTIDGTDLLEELSKPRNLGFYSAVSDTDKSKKNTIKACVHQNMTVVSGQEIIIRLLEPIQVDNSLIPVNTLVTGVVTINGERLHIHISSVEHSGNIYPVSLTAYDTYGMQGVAIPGSDEVNAAKEIAANMSSNMGSTINLSRQGAGEQLLTDMGRSLIQGTSQYAAKKIRTIKVTLKANHQLFLLPM